ncbi:MAG: cupin domain-containing protein [Chloroflexota bacterium]|nr:cupin domain-containing protein [Chloroflexota bacterium]
MRVIRVTKAGRERSDNPIFVGDVDYQTAVGEESRDLSLSEVHFKRGAVNKPHMHTTDQILIITEGEGLVASDSERHDVSAGDVALIPANTKHWHGARPGKDMTHWSILGHGKTTIVDS